MLFWGWGLGRDRWLILMSSKMKQFTHDLHGQQQGLNWLLNFCFSTIVSFCFHFHLGDTAGGEQWVLTEVLGIVCELSACTACEPSLHPASSTTFICKLSFKSIFVVLQNPQHILRYSLAVKYFIAALNKLSDCEKSFDRFSGFSSL